MALLSLVMTKNLICVSFCVQKNQKLCNNQHFIVNPKIKIDYYWIIFGIWIRFEFFSFFYLKKFKHANLSLAQSGELSIRNRTKTFNYLLRMLENMLFSTCKIKIINNKIWNIDIEFSYSKYFHIINSYQKTVRVLENWLI